MPGFVQIWSSQQLEKGAPGCPDYHGTTGPNTHAIVLSNDSENTLLYRSDVDPGLYVPPRTSLTIPCDSNMQYVLSVDISSVPTTTSNQLVILSETNQELAYSSLQLPAPNLIQYITTTFGGIVTIPPEFTGIIVVPIDTTANLQIYGEDSGYQYYNGPVSLPIVIQLYPGLEPSNTFNFADSGGATLNIYGLTIPLTTIGTPVFTNAAITSPLRTFANPVGYTSAENVLNAISTLAAWNETDPSSFTNINLLRATQDNVDAVAAVADGALKVLSRLYGWNGADYDRLRALSDNVDGVTANVGALLALARNTLFNGATWDRQPGSTQGAIVDPIPARQLVATSTANAPVTLTIPAPGSNQRIQIDWLRVDIWNPSAAALNGTPDAINFTGLDMANGPVYSRVIAIGGVTTVIDQSFPHGLRASLSNNAVTITANAIGAGCLSRIIVGYHIDQAVVT